MSCDVMQLSCDHYKAQRSLCGVTVPTWSRKHFAMSSRDPLAPSNKSRNELGRNQHGRDTGIISSITLLPHAYPWWNSYTA